MRDECASGLGQCLVVGDEAEVGRAQCQPAYAHLAIYHCNARETDSVTLGLARRLDNMQQPSVSKDGTSAVSEQNADEKVASTSGIVSGDEIFGRTSSTGSRASKTAASKTRKKASKSTFNDDSRAVALPGGRLVSGPDDTGLMRKALSKQKSLISSSTLFAHEQATLPRLGSGRDIAGMMADVSVSPALLCDEPASHSKPGKDLV